MTDETPQEQPEGRGEPLGGTKDGWLSAIGLGFGGLLIS